MRHWVTGVTLARQDRSRLNRDGDADVQDGGGCDDSGGLTYP